MYRIFYITLILASCATLSNTRNPIIGTDKDGNLYKIRILKSNRKSDSAVVTGFIRGIVYDQAGLAASTLIISDGHYKIADDQGRFHVRIVPGIYQLQTVSIGYAPLNLPSLELRKGDSLVVDCALSIKIDSLY